MKHLQKYQKFSRKILDDIFSFHMNFENKVHQCYASSITKLFSAKISYLENFKHEVTFMCNFSTFLSKDSKKAGQCENEFCSMLSALQ